MSLRTSDVVPISEARARLTELAQEVVEGGAEKPCAMNFMKATFAPKTAVA